MVPAWATWQGLISESTKGHGCKGRKERTKQWKGNLGMTKLFLTVATFSLWYPAAFKVQLKRQSVHLGS